MIELEDKVTEIHLALTRRRIPHAFGGAIALAYWTKDARGTADIDINIFLAAEECEQALAALPPGVAVPDGTVERILRDRQIRLKWDETPIDLFFDYAQVHSDAAQHRTMVAFRGTEIPILGPVELAIFKVMFDRMRDWGDIEEMVKARTLDTGAVRASVREMLGPEDRRFDRLAEIEERAKRPR